MITPITPQEEYDVGSLGNAIMLSVVVPAYNEADNLGPLWEELRPVLDSLGVSFEVLVIDDGSTDSTPTVLAKLTANDPRIHTISLVRNSGKSAAIAAAATRVAGEITALLDADLQADPRDLPHLLALLEKYDFVNGVRAKRNDPWPRLFASQIGNGFRNLVTGETIRDSVSPLKLIRTRFLRTLKPFHGYHRFLPTLARLEGATVIETPIIHRPRLHGGSKYSNLGRGRRGFFDVFAVRWMIDRHIAFDVRSE